MSTLEKLEGFKFENVEFEPVPPSTLRIKGTITVPDCAKELRPYLERLHRAVLDAGIAEYHVDMTGLTFADSSVIRLFVEWVTWLMQGRTYYRLVFTIDRTRTWQRTALAALQSLAGNIVRVRP